MATKSGKPAHVYPVPSNFDKIQKLRAKKDFTMKPCEFVKDSVNLYYYQVIGSVNMMLSTRMVLGDEPGLGKTIQTLVCYAYMRKMDPELKLLVVTTKSARRQWGDEVTKFLQNLGHHVVKADYKPKGHTRQISGYEARKAQYEEHRDTPILITGYHSIKEDYEILAEARGPKFMVAFDECQEFKNDETHAFLGADYVSQRAMRVYGLTATPIKNRLVEFYNIMRVVMPGLFPGITRFKDTFCKQELKTIYLGKNKKRMVKEVTGYKNLDVFVEAMSPYFLARPATMVEGQLPQLSSRKAVVEMNARQKKLYAEAVAGIVYLKKTKQRFLDAQEALKAAGQNPSEKLVKDYELRLAKYEEALTEGALENNKGAALVYCQLVANGGRWVDKEEDWESPKEDEFRRLVVDELDGRKVIVFTRFKTGIPVLEKILDKEGIKHCKVTGDENDTQREAAKKVFQDPDDPHRVIFITAAGSAAINLQTASILIFFDSPWSYGDLVQILGRFRRLGSQHQHILAIHMVSEGTIDEHVLDLLEEKKDLVDKVVGRFSEGALAFNKEVDVGTEQSEVANLFSKIFSGRRK
jgi:SNF2 family DNA or RNA helicase